MKLAKTQIILATIAILTAGAASTNVLLDNFATINQTTTIDHPTLAVDEADNNLVLNQELGETTMDDTTDYTYSVVDVGEWGFDLNPQIEIPTSSDEINDESQITFSANLGDDDVVECTVDLEPDSTQECGVLEISDNEVNEFELDIDEAVGFDESPIVILKGDNS